jgi:hypothetical protein
MATSTINSILLGILLIVSVSLTANAQKQTFTTDRLDYVLDLPSASWRPVSRIDVHEHFEFVNGADYSNGHLRLRKKFVAAVTGAADIFREDEKWELQRLPGYVSCNGGSGSDFVGNLRGRVFAYEYVSQGKNMDGRIYYLQVDSRTFYALYFTIASDKLGAGREQIDSIAKSFRLK